MSICATPGCNTSTRAAHPTCSYCRQKQYKKKCAYIDPEGVRCNQRGARIYCDQHTGHSGPTYNRCTTIINGARCEKRCLGEVCAAHNPATRQRIRDKRAVHRKALQTAAPVTDS